MKIPTIQVPRPQPVYQEEAGRIFTMASNNNDYRNNLDFTMSCRHIEYAVFGRLKRYSTS